MEAQQHGDQLKRGLKNRHIQLIALGGAIGTGLFLGSASVIQSAGPGIILGYAIAGFIAFLNHAPAGRNGRGRAGRRLLQPLCL